MLDCPIEDMHYFIYGIIKTALKKVYKKDREHSYETFIKESNIHKFFQTW